MVGGDVGGSYVTMRRSWPCVMHVKDCTDGTADVGCISGGCDPGARSVYASSDGTRGRPIQA